jgi:hypothetical protein
MSDFEDIVAPPEEEENDEPVWVPAQLEVTRKRVQNAREDSRHVRKCVLCELATGETHCTGKFADLLNYEKRYRRAMEPEILYKAMADLYNKDIVRMKKERPNYALSREERNFDLRETTLAEMRQHFEADHDRDWKRMLENRLDYLNASARQLEESSLWQQNVKSPGDPLRPDGRNIDTYLKITEKMEKLYQKLSGNNGVTAQRIGKQPRR